MKKYFLVALGAVFCFIAGCAVSEQPAASSDPAPNPEPPLTVPPPDIITGTIEMEDGGIITFELYHDIAPQSVQNFVELARLGFYDGLKFHRIISGFMIQGGCPDGSGGGNPGYSITGEFESNNIKNSLKHTRGVMSMARSNDFNSAGSQFFICHGDPSSLNGKYAAFGMVTGGMEIVDAIAETPVLDSNGKVSPDNMPVIRSITIDGDFYLPGPDKIAR